MKLNELNGLWAIEKNALQKLSTIKADMVPDETDADESGLDATIIEGIAVVPVTGILTKYDWGIGTSTLQLKNLLNSLVVSTEVSGIILWVDSPGGEVSGTGDVANVIAA